MKNIIAILAIFLIGSGNIRAQKGFNRLMIGADVGLPTGDFGDAAKIGPGVITKFLFGVTQAGQVTVTSGVTFYGLKGDVDAIIPDNVKVTMYIIPILAGYRHNFNGFFLEPQVGIGVFGAKATYQGESESDSDNAFAWAAGFGYTNKNLEIGLRYQSMEKDSESLSLIGIHVGFILNLSKK